MQQGWQFWSHVVAHALIVVAVLAAIIRAILKCGVSKFTASAVSAVREQFEALLPRSRRSQDPALRDALNLELGKLRVIIAMTFFQLMTLGALIASVVVLNIALRGETVPCLMHLISLPTFSIIVIIPALFPCVLTERTTDIWACIMHAASAFSVSPWALGDDCDRIFEVSLFANLVSFFACSVNLKMRVTIFVSLIHLVVMFWADIASNHGNTGRDFTNLVVMLFLAKTGGFFAVERMVTSYARDIVGSNIKSDAMRSLLRMVCDAVVSLDEDGHMQDDERWLATMLFLANDRSLVGEKFVQYVKPGDDAQRFLDAIRPDTSRQPCLLHSRLRDAWGSVIKMQLFIVPFHTSVGKSCCLVGVKEEPGESVMRDIDARPSTSATSQGGGRSVAVDGGANQITCDVPQGPPAQLNSEIAQAVIQYQETRSFSRPGSISSTDGNRIVADVLPEEGLPIRFASEGLRQAYEGFERGKTLLPLFPVRGNELVQWIKERDAAVLRGVRPSGAQRFGYLHVGEATNLPEQEDPQQREQEQQQQRRPQQRRRVSVRIGKVEHSRHGALFQPGTANGSAELSDFYAHTEKVEPVFRPQAL